MHECVCMGERRRVLAPVYPYLSSMQRACVILSFAASSSPSYFFWHYLIKGTILEKNLLDIKCVSIFSTNFFKPFLILREISSKRTTHYRKTRVNPRITLSLCEICSQILKESHCWWKNGKQLKNSEAVRADQERDTSSATRKRYCTTHRVMLSATLKA